MAHTHPVNETFRGSMVGKIALVAFAITAVVLPMSGPLSTSTVLAQDKTHDATLSPDYTIPTHFHQGNPIIVAEEINTSRPWDRKAAFRASTDRIVLHYGKGMKRVDALAAVLNERGKTTLAVAGGPENGIEAFVGRSVIRKKFTQRDVDDGTLGSLAVQLFEQKFASQPDVIPLAK